MPHTFTTTFTQCITFCKYCNVLDSLFYDPSQSYHLRHKAFNAVVLTKDKKLVDQFMEAHPNLRNDLINVKTDGFCFDIFNADNDKSKGIEMILEKTGFSWKDTICFGDSTNDIHMLKKQILVLRWEMRVTL